MVPRKTVGATGVEATVVVFEVDDVVTTGIAGGKTLELFCATFGEALANSFFAAAGLDAPVFAVA